MRIAILGGTFDPVHIGHLLVADEVLARLDYEQIRFVPARIPPHKDGTPSASSEHRLAMLRLAVASRPEFVVDPFEVQSDGVSYTVRTLRHIVKQEDVSGRPGLIIGQDLVSGFSTWREADEIERLAELILVRRPLADVPDFDREHALIDNVKLEVSSTEIRDRAEKGLPYRYLVVPEVYEYIREQGLYRASSASVRR